MLTYWKAAHSISTTHRCFDYSSQLSKIDLIFLKCGFWLMSAPTSLKVISNASMTFSASAFVSNSKFSCMDDMKHIPVDEFLKGVDRHLPASEKVEMVLEWLPTARTSKDIETIEKWLRKNISKPVLNAAAIFTDPTDLQLDGVDRFFVFGSKGVAEIEHPLGKEGFY